MDERITSYDLMLHQSLDKIFGERCSSISSSSQFKKFRCGPQHSTDWKSIIKPILDQEPIISEHFSKEELEKLSLLWISVLARYEKSAELLVRSGADVNELFGRHNPQLIDEKCTVLHVLLQMDPLLSPENERLIRLVTDHGADLQARDYKARTVLHYALCGGQVQMTKMLLEKGADVNAADDQGMTPMLFAAVNSKADELVQLLMKYGADVLAKDGQGRNALYHLSNSVVEHAELARVFIEKGVSLDDKEHLSHSQPIHRAAKWNHHELVKLFLDHGANVNAQTKTGESPVYFAALTSPNILVMQTLLNRGANVNLRAEKGQTALHVACKLSAWSTLPPIQFAYRRKEDIESMTANIKLLLSAGADVLAQDSDGNTPLALILSGENVEPPGIRLLIKALALKKSLQSSIELKDEMIIQRDLILGVYYQDDMEEIDRMKSTRFIKICTLFELLTKSHCQIAVLMRNPNFESKFQQCDLSGFSTYYAEDIRRAFERAQNHYRAMVEQENVINEALYDMLPHIVVRRIVHYICNGC